MNKLLVLVLVLALPLLLLSGCLSISPDVLRADISQEVTIKDRQGNSYFCKISGTLEKQVNNCQQL
jgi:hypothetical protein